MKLVETRCQPLVLARPIGLIFGVGVVEIARDTATLGVRPLLPVESIAELRFDGVFLTLQDPENCLGLWSSEPNRRPKPVLQAIGVGAQTDMAATN